MKISKAHYNQIVKRQQIQNAAMGDLQAAQGRAAMAQEALTDAVVAAAEDGGSPVTAMSGTMGFVLKLEDDGYSLELQSELKPAEAGASAPAATVN